MLSYVRKKTMKVMKKEYTHPHKAIMEEESKSGRSSHKSLLEFLCNRRANQLLHIGACVPVEDTT